jgi:HK97 family phage prohead protease
MAPTLEMEELVAKKPPRDTVLFCEAEFRESSDGDPGTVEGLASTWQEDLHGDIIHPGAFKKTVSERVPARRVPFLDGHMWVGASVLGTVVEARETDRGLWFRAQLSSAASAQETRTKMLEKHLNFTSIGFRPIHQDFEEVVIDEGSPPKIIRHIREVKLYEISAVPIPANEGARIERVKSLLELTSLDELIHRVTCGKEVPDDEIFDGIRRLAACLQDEAQAAEIICHLSAEPPASEADPPPLTEPETINTLRARLRALSARLQKKD